MEHLLKIEYMSKDEIEDIISLAIEYKNGKKACFNSNHAILMFYENSTRTRFSFECAIQALGAHSYVFESSKSSIQKGEKMFDTLNNLAAIGINTFIIRTKEEGFLDSLASKKYYLPVHFVNAGEGKETHPTQALLDYMTMKLKLGDMKNKKVAIIGDIKHSRVAKSNIALLNKVGAKVFTCAPEYFREEIEGATFVSDLKLALKDADVAMSLRIQTERLEGAISRDDFIKHYQINSSNMPSHTLLMHPGPVNRDIEISSDLLDSSIGRTILEQAENGKCVRMSVLDKIFTGGVLK